MPLRQVNSPDQIYDAVHNHDLVITPEAPLALALDRRVHTPRLGRLAATPRSHAANETRPEDDRRLFTELVTGTDLTYKQAAYYLTEALDCWQQTGDPSNLLDYDRYRTDAARTVVAHLEQADSTFHTLANTTIPDDKDIAVVGEEWLTDLDRTILPDSYDTVDPFTDATTTLPAVHVYDSTTAIIDELLTTVTADTADQVGIVVDRQSHYAPLVEAAFDAHDIPYRGGPGFLDAPQIKTFLRLLRAAFAGDNQTVGAVRPLLTSLGFDLDARADAKRLTHHETPAINRYQTFAHTARTSTVGETLDAYETLADTTLPDLRTELDQLHLTDQPVTEATISDLEYYLQAYEVPVDRDTEGVLLADATASAYVDRPVVFYLGLGSGWTAQIPDRPWIDRQAHDQQALEQFELLLQNGQEQYLLVEDTRHGEVVTPCLYLQELVDADIERFTDLPHTRHHSPGQDTTTTAFPDAAPTVDADTEPTTTLSQSSLNTLVNCPRDYFFDQLVETPTAARMVKGTVFHDVAEFYLDHPALVTDNHDQIVDICYDKLEPYTTAADEPIVRSELAAGIDILTSYLDQYPPTETTYDRYEKHNGDNLLAEAFDVALTSTLAEQWFADPELGAHGVVDLIQNPTTLLDYKSGSQSSAGSIVSDAATDEISDTPDFQALLYLAHHTRAQPDERLDFTFFHFMELHDDAVTDQMDIEDALTTVTYYPQSFSSYVATQDAFDACCAGVAESNNRRKTLERLGVDAYTEFFTDQQFPEVDSKDELLDTPLAEAFIDHAVDHVGDYKYVRKGCRSTMKTLFDIRGANFFAEDVESFEQFLDAQLDQLAEYHETRFPVGEPNWDRVDHRELILDD